MQYAAPDLWLTSKCLDTISREIQLHLPLRTGGTLLGQGVHTRSKDITHAITAGPHAIRTKETFRADDAYQAEQINALLTQEASDTQYIGDWFYDPDATYFSHSTYLKSMKERAHSGSEPFVCNNPVLLLVTYKDDQLKFYGFQYSHSEAIAPSPAPGWPFETHFDAYDSMNYHEVRIYGRRQSARSKPSVGSDVSLSLLRQWNYSMTLSFEWESTHQIRAIHIGPKGYLIYSEAGSESLRAIRFEVWCFHLSVTDPSLSFPVSGSTVTCSQLRTNGLFLLAIANNAFTLKLNIATEPAEGPTIAEFRAGLSIAHPEASRATATEIEILLDWLITAHTEVKTPLPGLTAIDLVSDAIYQYLALPNHTVHPRACSRLKSLINKFMDYDLTAQGYVNALIALKKTAVSY